MHHKVTSSERSGFDVVSACQDGEYVELDGDYYRVCHRPGGAPEAVALDRCAGLGGGVTVNRLPPGTIITIVVGGEVLLGENCPDMPVLT